MSTIKKNRGVATIPIILALGTMILAIGVGITAISFTEGIVAQGGLQSSKALIYAEAGARDALERIGRDKNYACADPDCYEVSFAENGCSANLGCARVSVSTGVGSLADPKVITSKGQTGNNIRTLEVEVILDDALNGEISTTTWTEI